MNPSTGSGEIFLSRGAGEPPAQLHLGEDLAYRQIADRLDVSEPTVKTQMFPPRSRLMAALTEVLEAVR